MVGLPSSGASLGELHKSIGRQLERKRVLRALGRGFLGLQGSLDGTNIPAKSPNPSRHQLSEPVLAKLMPQHVATVHGHIMPDQPAEHYPRGRVVQAKGLKEFPELRPLHVVNMHVRLHCLL